MTVMARPVVLHGPVFQFTAQIDNANGASSHVFSFTSSARMRARARAGSVLCRAYRASRGPS